MPYNNQNMKDILCTKTGTPCPAKVLIAELEEGRLRDNNIEGSILNVISGAAAEALAKSARDLLSMGDCSVGPGYEVIEETAVGDDDEEVDYLYSIDSCTNSNTTDLDLLGLKHDLTLTYFDTDIPAAG